MISLKRSFANCLECSLLDAPSCIMETNCKNDLIKVDIIFIAENPGKDEVKKGVPLIGKAGKLFRKYFDKILKDNCNWLLTNCVLCATIDKDGKTINPTDDVIDRCKVNCFEIIKQCNPKLVVLMGTSPMKAFGIAKSGITNLRGKTFEWEGYNILLTIHPSFIARGNVAYESLFEEDLLLAGKLIGSLEEVYNINIQPITKTNKEHTGIKGIHRYKIPEHFYTEEYRLVDIQSIAGKQILYIFRDKNNNKVYHKENDDYYYYIVPDGVPARKIIPYDELYQSKIPYREKAQLNHNISYEGDIRLTVKHAMDYYHYNKGEAKRLDSNIMFFDIEIDTGINNRSFPSPKEALYPINMITSIYHGNKTCYVVDKWNETEPIEPIDGVEIKTFINDKDLLKEFIKDFKEIDPDFITGWNCIYENEIIFLKDRLIYLKDLKPNLETYKYGNIIDFCNSGQKDCIELELKSGHKIKSSLDHKFPVYIKNNDNTFYTSKKLLNSEQELTTKEIIESENEIFFRLDRCTNTNKNYTYGNLIKDNIEILLEYDLVDIKIISKKLRDKVIKTGDHKKIFKRSEYWQGSKCYMHHLWSYKNLKKYITLEEIKEQLEDFDIQVFKVGKVNNIYINMNKCIKNNTLQLLGFLYTDGFWSVYDKGFCFDNKDSNIIYHYNKIMNKYRYHKIIDFEHKWNKRDNLYTIGFGFTNEFIILMPLIYSNNRNNRKKRLNLTSLSKLSFKQWCSFFSGIIDGAGSSNNCNIMISCFEDDGKDCNRLHNLLSWNGVFSYLRENGNIIPRTIYNKKFLSNLKCYHNKRKIWANNKYLIENKNSCSNIVNKFFYDDFILVKLKKYKIVKNLNTFDLETKDHYFICNGIKTHNSIGFDMEYIFNRMKRIQIPTSSFSKFGEFYVDGFRFVCNLVGCSVLDQMHLYKMFTFTKLENYTLDFVAKTELNKQKIKLEYPINEMYYKALNKLIQYNIRDTELLLDLENKLKHINLLNELRVICRSSFEGASSSFGQIDSIIVSFLREKGLASKNADPHIVKEKYPGAFVLEPTPGIYNKVTDFDFSSLYPSIIITYNIGNNNFVMKTMDPEIGYDLAYLPFEQWPETIDIIEDPTFEAKEVKIKKEELLKRIKDENLIHTINGCFYKNHKDEESYYAQVLIDILDSRKMYKRKMFDAKQVGDEDGKELYNTRQLVYKVLANSLYGVIANKAFRFFDIYCAAAITLGGQEALKTSIIEGEEIMRSLKTKKEYKPPKILSKKEMYTYPDDDPRSKYQEDIKNRNLKFITTGDTDSIFTNFGNFKKEDVDTDEKIKKLCDEVQTFLNNDIIPIVVKRHNAPIETNRLELKNELIISRGLFLAKKRYAIHVTNNEGRETDQINYMGLEIKRSDYPSASKNFLKELVELILKTDKVTLPKLFKFVENKELEFREMINKGDIRIARPVSFGKKLEEYKTLTQGVRAMLAFNELVYNAHVVGSRGYLFRVNGIDLDKAPKEVVDNYNKKFLPKGQKLDVIAVPDDYDNLPEYFIPDMKANLRFAFEDRYNLMLSPLTEVKKQKEIMTI